MKQTFTKLFGIASAALLIAGTAQAQTLASVETLHKGKKADTTTVRTADKKGFTISAADPDTAWKPQRRVWGYSFGDFSYVGHAPAVTSTFGKENNYYQVPTGRNQFQFRRIYLGYDYEITRKFKAELLLEAAPNENTQPTTSTSSVTNGDNLADGKIAFYIKNFNLRTRDLWTGTDFVIGEMSTPGFALNEPGTNAPTTLSEATWGYRSIEKTITDFHSNNSFDVGAALQGTFDPATKNFGYVLMVGNNTKATNVTLYNANSGLSTTNPQPNSGFFKIFYGDIWSKFAGGHVVADFYADYAQTASTTINANVTAGQIGTQEHNMFKLFVAYTTPKFTAGAEGYVQKFDLGVINNSVTTDKVAENTNVRAASFFVRGVMAPGWNYFARFDTYNPDTKFNAAGAYGSVLTNYGSYDPTVKQQFYTFGLDYNPTKNVHFMPNIWLDRYFSEYNKGVTGYVPDNHTLVYRLTFFFTFGK
jgi:hypothetical protein